MAGELHELLEAVHDERSFLAFARELIADRERAVAVEREPPAGGNEPDAEGWENVQIETYLSAAVSWAEDSDFGERQGLSSANPWKQFAVFLYCGKIYE